MTTNDILYGPAMSEQELYELVGAPKRAASVVKAARKELANNSGKSSARLRAENLAKKFFPEDIRKSLEDGSMTLAPHQYYHALALSGATQGVFFKDIDAVPGTSNVFKGKTSDKLPFVCLGIKVLSGVNATLGATNYGTPAADVRNGDFRAMFGTAIIFDRLPIEAFNSSGDANRENGLLTTDGIYLPPATALEMSITLPIALATNTNVKILLQGFSAVVAPAKS